MENIYDIIGKLLAALAVGLLAYLTPKVKEWLSANTDDATEAAVLRMVRSFARAAEQLYHDQDPDGTIRKKYVCGQLQELGIAVTDAVIDMIEGAVWEINTETHKAQVQAKEIVFDADSLREAVAREVQARLSVEDREAQRPGPDAASKDFRRLVGIGTSQEAAR